MRTSLSLLLVLSALAAPLHAVPAKPAPNMPAVAAQSRVERNAPLPRWAEMQDQLPDSQSGEPVVYRLAEVQYWTGPHQAYTVSRAVQVNSSARLAEIGQVSIPFKPAYQKVLLHRVAIVREGQVQNRIASADVRVLDDEAQADQGSYVGAANVRILLEDVKPGDTLWLTYTVEGSNPVFGTAAMEVLPWTKPEPIALRKVVFIHPPSAPFAWRVSGAARPSLPPPAIEQRPGQTRVTFTERNLAADDYEPAVPAHIIPMPLIDTTAYKDWAEVNRWALTLFAMPPGQSATAAQAARFTGLTPEAKAAATLHWVQNEIRYFSVSIGENSHRPQAPDVVLRRRFGDCKDKSLLLVALYRAMGLEAQPVLVNSTLTKLPGQMLPSPGSFNHAIVRVVLGGQAYFVDPTRTGELGPIARLPPAVPGGSALVVAADTSALTTLPDELAGTTQVERIETLNVATLQGDGQLKVRSVYRGRMAAAMRTAYQAMGSFDVKKWVLSEVEHTYPGIVLAKPPASSDSEDGAAFAIETEYKVPRPLKEKEGQVELAARSHVLEGTLGIPDKLVRKHPLWLSAGRYRARYTLEASLPNESRLISEDDQINVENKHLQARAQVTWRGAHLQFAVDYAILEPEVPAAELPALEEQARKLNPLYENTFRFKPAAAAPGALKEASLRTLDIMRKMGSYVDLARAFTNEQTGKVELDPKDFASLSFLDMCASLYEAYAVRAWSPWVRAPIAALSKLLRDKADQSTQDACAGQMAYLSHDWSAALRLWERVPPRDADPWTLRRAWAQFHGGDRTAAQATLARFLTATASAEKLRAHEALLATALARRLGQAEPDPVRQLTSRWRPDAWPAPLFRRLRRELTGPELLAAVERLPAPMREHALLEVHFTLAQAFMAEHAPSEADLYINRLLHSAPLASDFEMLAMADRYAAAWRDPDVIAAFRARDENCSADSTMELWRKAAERGLPLAEYELARCYLHGTTVLGMARDRPHGIELLLAAARHGVDDAWNELGNAYADGKLAPRDDAKAMDYYAKGVEHGNPIAAYNLGHAYWLGEHGKQVDYVRAFPLMKMGAESGDSSSQFFLSRHYLEPKGTARDDTLATFWAAQSAIRNDIDGIAQLGKALLLTGMTDTERTAGASLLQHAVLKRNTFAYVEWGRILLDGVGYQADPDTASKFIVIAANDNNDRGKALLGRMLAAGLGVRQDLSKGLALLEPLATAGHPEALLELGRLYRGAAAGVTDKAKAADYLQRAADRGQAEAAEMLAVMLHTGEGIPQDLVKAARYYALAVTAGRPRAMNNLASMYEQGEGVEKSMERARDLYRRSAQYGNLLAMLNMGEIQEADPDRRTPFVPLCYFLLADHYGLAEAGAPAARLKQAADKDTLERATKFVADWRPGHAMPDQL